MVSQVRLECLRICIAEHQRGCSLLLPDKTCTESILASFGEVLVLEPQDEQHLEDLLKESFRETG